MDAIISGAIWVILGDFLMTFAVVGIVVGAIVAAAHRRRGRHDTWATVLDWFLLFGIGVSSTYNFVMHSVFGDFSAATIGWAQSPFQLEVAFASLGMGVVGFLAFTRHATLFFKAAAIIGPGVFLWGAAAGHVYQSITNDDFAFSNAGPILYTDILLPVVGLVLVALARREARAARGPARGSAEVADAPAPAANEVVAAEVAEGSAPVATTRRRARVDA